MEKFLKLNKKDLKEIEENIKRNHADRMRYIDQYTDWLKKNTKQKMVNTTKQSNYTKLKSHNLEREFSNFKK